MNGKPVYGKSPVNGTYYKVTDYEVLGDGRIKAKQKEEVSEEKVPEVWRENL
jgi:hypothetical protein